MKNIPVVFFLQFNLFSFLNKDADSVQRKRAFVIGLREQKKTHQTREK